MTTEIKRRDLGNNAGTKCGSDEQGCKKLFLEQGTMLKIRYATSRKVYDRLRVVI
ncbi:unnamed protein product [Fusarium graminearum]|uniref:Chromosome 3, complete genome n=1 Tax=Gibberella zeae (strain ATCC MYA-4620 / CBS 123657 / FGSC 9075 / NRRL 31084 / PH-1) TaxID=229533 RepID=A0A098E069_GIBZE|nr:unnamed protein product [Fusarium graminearum]CZS84088.1 unnamed protein product [Fusarium graminearum]